MQKEDNGVDKPTTVSSRWQARDQQILSFINNKNEKINIWNSSKKHQKKFSFLVYTSIHSDKIKSLIGGIDFSKIDLGDVSLDIVDGCNLRCIGCPNSTLKPSVLPVPADIVIQRVKNIDVGHIERLRLYRYGEPLFNKQLPEIITRLKQLEQPKVGTISISTNAQHRNLSILEKTLSTGMLDTLCISADGDGTKESYERLRPPGKFEILEDFISSARRIIDDKGVNTTIQMGITLLHSQITKDNYKCDKNAKSIWISKFGDYVDKFDFHPMLKMPGSLLDEQGAFDHLEYYAPRARDGACGSVVSPNLYVDGKGIIQPCCWSIDVANLGDLNHQKFSQNFLSRLSFKSILDANRLSWDPCGSCAQKGDEGRLYS